MSKIAVTDIRIPDVCATALQSYGFEVIKLPAFSRLSAPVASHPDMLICPIGDEIITHKEYFLANENIFNLIAKHTDKKIVLSEDEISDKYPLDVSFNALIINNVFFSLNSHTSTVLLEAASKCGYDIANVKQGYTKCSVCRVSDTAAITSDTSLSNSMISCGIDVLKISEGGVALPPYEYGFIGGASGCDEDHVFFCGSLKSHPQGELISKFCLKHSKIPISLSDDPLLDIGSIFII